MASSSLATSPTCALLHCKGVGSEAWWQKITALGTPLITLLNGAHEALVTFVWRDLLGCEASSPYQKVWINLTGLTDHHAGSAPRSLARIPGTDVWYYQHVVDARWRGSYCFVPSCVADDVPSSPRTLASLQQWWRHQLPHATFDPLNTRPAWLSARGHPASGIVLPLASYSDGWQHWDQCPAPIYAPERLQRHIWYSPRLKTYRTVWVFETGETHDAQRPLALLLDGQFWARQMPIWSPLMHDTHAQRLPGAVYVLIDSIDNVHRKRDMVCSPDFWDAVQQELLPLVSQWAAHDESPWRTVVAGQSLGGVGAMYAGMRWPHRFGNVLSQSGAYWCLTPSQWQVFSNNDTPLTVFLQSGTHEPRIHEGHAPMLQALKAASHDVTYRIEPGGHDAMWWREGLLEGLQHLWRSTEKKRETTRV